MNIFEKGAKWMRVDFHLHTKADKEFVYSPKDDKSSFTKEYVEKLKEANLSVGVITNHNKFDKEEYKNLKRKANKEGIYLIAGVELSIDDGSNGIHCLIAFNEKWWQNRENTDYINTFLTNVFEDIPNRESENTRCKLTLLDVLKKLGEHKQKGRDCFVIMAHVEAKSGFFQELGGGRIIGIAKEKSFQDLVLGFQKVRSNDKIQSWKQWFQQAECQMPAFVEGSDCKNLREVGRCHLQNENEKSTYIKLGKHTFNAVKFALINHELRISKDLPPQNGHSYIEKISFTGGKLNERTLNFTPNLNCLIGLPGSGKSSILEAVRFILGYDLTKKDSSIHNIKYKTELVNHFLQSGGKGILSIVNRDGVKYSIERTLNGDSITKNENGDEINIDIQEIIRFIYFGQKDLTYQGEENFNFDFLHKFLKKEVKPYEEDIEIKNKLVRTILDKIGEIEVIRERKEDLTLKVNGLIEKLRLYEEYEVDKKMEKQKKFEDDINFVQNVDDTLKQVLKKLSFSIKEEIHVLDSITPVQSIDNEKEIKLIESNLKEIKNKILNFNLELVKLAEPEDEKTVASLNLAKIQSVLIGLKGKEKQLKEHFEQIRRAIDIATLNVDEYPEISRERDELLDEIDALNEKINAEEKLEDSLRNHLIDLRKAWKNEFDFFNKMIEEINNKKLSVTIQINPRGSKQYFSEFLISICSNSGIRKEKLKKIAQKYHDTIEIWDDIHSPDSWIKAFLNLNHFNILISRCEKCKSKFLTFKVPYGIELFYQNKPISKHSDGQKASAIILFTLNIGEQDLLFIDQPEDDLNSGDIYKEIVKNLIRKKEESQFLFATHDANITVLGDCEQIFCCDYFDQKMDFKAGSIDCVDSQANIIKVMEGGEDAFNERNKVYSIWKEIN